MCVKYGLDLNSVIALLRLEGHVSISSISEVLYVLGYKFDSTGMVSERLKFFGRCLSNTLNIDREYLVFYLSDEIFSLGPTILLTIDPVSTAILRIELADNRQADNWKSHYQCLEGSHFNPNGLASDCGAGIIIGFQAVFEDKIWCSDHFHEFRDLAKLSITLETQAYAAIAKEDERLRVFDNAKSEANLQKRLQEYESARADCEEKIAQYQHVSDILNLLFPTLYFFDPATGQHRQERHVKSDVLTLMDLLFELTLPKLQQETQTIRNHIDDICVCYSQVEEICQELAKTIPEETLRFMGLVGSTTINRISTRVC